jgi:hypothetical protein
VRHEALRRRLATHNSLDRDLHERLTLDRARKSRHGEEGGDERGGEREADHCGMEGVEGYEAEAGGVCNEELSASVLHII